MSRSTPGNKETHASRRDILKKGAVLGGVAAAGTIGPDFAQEAFAKTHGKEAVARKHRKEHRRRFGAPNRYDLRDIGNLNYITPVQNQDAYGACNSCTAFALVAAVEGSYNFQQNRPIQPTDMQPGFSEAELFFCANVQGGCVCAAWYPEAALDLCISQGLTDRSNNNGSTQSCVMPGPNWKWTKLQAKQKLVDATEMKKWISGNSSGGVGGPGGTGGPVISVMIEYADLRTKPNDPTNPYTPAPDTVGSPNTIVGGHVVCIVGYDDTTTPKYWICKNSWGSNWNSGGYLYIAQENPGHPVTYINSFDMWGVVV